jgi:heme exporter protein C
MLWNLAGWFVWGVMLVLLRYKLERKRQRIEQKSAVDALEAELQTTP